MKKSILVLLLLSLFSLSYLSAANGPPNIDPDTMDPDKNKVVVAQFVYNSDIPPRIGFARSRVNSVINPTDKYTETDVLNFSFDSVTSKYSANAFAYVQLFGGENITYTINISTLQNSNVDSITPAVTINGSAITGLVYSQKYQDTSFLPHVICDEISLSVPVESVKYTTAYEGSITLSLVVGS